MAQQGPEHLVEVHALVVDAGLGDLDGLAGEAETAFDVVAEPETAGVGGARDLGGVDDCELDEAAMAALEARMTSRPATELTASQIHAERFGASTMSHYRAVYAQTGAPWPGEAFVRRHHPVADVT